MQTEEAEQGNKSSSLQNYAKSGFSRRKGRKHLLVPRDTEQAAFLIVRKVKDLNSSRGAVVSPTLPPVKGSKFINLCHDFHTAAFI